MKKVLVRTVTETRTVIRPASAISSATAVAIRATCALISAGSVRSRGKVSDRLRPTGTRGSLLTSVSPLPCPSTHRYGPVLGPNSAASRCRSAAIRSATVSMPRPASRAAMRLPMPHSAAVGRWPMTSVQFAAVSRKVPVAAPGSSTGAAEDLPADLAKPVASLAVSLLSPIPIAQPRSSSAIAPRISRASSSGSSVSAARNASSQPHTSTVPGNVRSTAITSSEASS
ncbi:Uncharacterised protein [Mycobacteroides abscessus subsp. abscessus]|nr:Uncharacterised protein [Mycobacteroides abscessus subsp. abscessus]